MTEFSQDRRFVYDTARIPLGGDRRKPRAMLERPRPAPPRPEHALPGCSEGDPPPSAPC